MIEQASRRWVFFINLPLALIVLVLTFWHIPESRNPKAGSRLDWLGAVLATIGLGGVIYTLIESSNRSWSDPVLIATLCVGLSSLTVFLIVEAYSPTPMLPLGIFRSRNFSGANLLTLFLYSALSGGLFFFRSISFKCRVTRRRLQALLRCLSSFPCFYCRVGPAGWWNVMVPGCRL